MISQIDIIRPGVTLLDKDSYNWTFVGKLKSVSKEFAGTKRWEDKWVREDGEYRGLSINEVYEKFAPLAVVLDNWTPAYRWWKTTDDFTMEEK